LRSDWIVGKPAMTYKKGSVPAGEPHVFAASEPQVPEFTAKSSLELSDEVTALLNTPARRAKLRCDRIHAQAG
jgi:hypothetical protein